MALKTQGFALSSMPRSPAIPANVGAVDVKEIYDGVRQGLAAFENVRRAPASMLLADAEMAAKTAEAPLGTRQVLAQTEGIEQQTPLKTMALAEAVSPERIAAERQALLAKGRTSTHGDVQLLNYIDGLRARVAEDPTDQRTRELLANAEAIATKKSAVTAADPQGTATANNASREKVAAAGNTTREGIAAAGNVSRETIASAANTSREGIAAKRPLTGLPYILNRLEETRRAMIENPEDQELKEAYLDAELAHNRISANSRSDPDADRTARASAAQSAIASREGIATADRTSREGIATQRNAATVNAAKVKFEVTKQAGASKAAAALESAENQTKRIDGLVDTAMGKVGLLTTGFGAALANLPATDARSLREDIETIKANLGFNELNAMRQASPTGGALGNVTERELTFLQKTIASLDQYLDGPDLIDRLEQVREDVKSSWGRVRRAYERQYGTQGAGPVVTPAANTPAFATPEEADAAGAAGTIQPGQKITVGGRGATWSP